MDLGLAGRSALVTGSSQGIGYAVARALAAEGAGPIHLAARSEATLAECAAALSADFGAEAIVHPLDLSRSENVLRLAESCADVDILVNNAGAIPRGNLLEVDERSWRDAWDLKVFGYINLTREIYRAMRGRGGGVIVNVAGSAGERPNFDYIAAGSGNAALIYFTEALGAESLKDGIRVVGVNPGPTTTERFIGGARKRAAARLGDPARWQELSAILPLGRPGDPEEVADLVAFLASDRAAYLSGVLVRIDGGLNVRAPAV